MKFTLTQQQVDQLLDKDRGGTTVHIEHNTWHKDMLSQAEALLHRFKTPASGNLISNYTYHCIDPSEKSIWTEVAHMIATKLNSELSQVLDLTDNIQFDDLYLTHYQKSDMGVSPHRDTKCKNIVASLILSGEPSFFICKSKEMNGSIKIPTTSGELMLMRGDQFQDLPRPFHYVGKTSGMLQFGMRQYINPPQQ